MEVVSASLAGLKSVLTLSTLWYVVFGACLGILVGIIPGLSGHFAMAMLVPFIFRMEPVHGLAFILGSHSAVAMGGGLTAILFATPGTGLNAATLLDGPGLTAKGQAGRAVGAALTSGFVGSMFGIIILTCLIPVLRSVVLVFGPPEFFMLALLALSFVAALSGRGMSMYRGLIAGVLGVLLALIGMCVRTGIPRFTFGFIELWSGLPLIPVMLGIFGVAEMLDLWSKGKGGSLASGSAALSFIEMQQQIFLGIKDALKRWWLILRCSSIGTVAGIIPGMGGSAGSFLAYAHAKQSEKNSEEFGTGVIEGVIAPESANHSVEGGALAATVAFGIPGSSSMAILLAAMIIMGITPGLELMTQRLDLVFVMIWTIVVGSFFTAILAAFITNPFARMTFIPSTIMVPALLAVVFTGAFSVHSVLFDCTLALIFGVLGFIMKKLDYSRPSFILGIILGSMIEKNFFLSMTLYGFSFFMHPVALVLFVLLIVVLAVNIYKQIKHGRAASEG